MPVYQPGIPTGTVNLDVDYLNLQGNFEQANIVYGTDHYPFNNATPNQGFHNLVTTPAVVNNPPDSLPPATGAGICKFYAYQQYPALGVLHYSRGPSNVVPSPVTNINSTAAAITLTPGAKTNVLDFTGFTIAMATLTVMADIAGANKRPLSQSIFWSQNAFGPFLTSGVVLRATNTGNVLEITNVSTTNTFDIYWTLEIIRIK